ncbi:MAG TPA: helix-turn-helix domain-containing protein [Solirubrobacterales bacterium]|nr:helix-turn-helix domain-containing protein [Solirubrobacterales bacterium]
MLGAAAEVFAERGYARTKSSDIARRAHVSRSTFYEHFENVADCLLAAYEMATDCVSDVVSGACEQGGERTARLRAAIDEALDLLASEPALANLLGPEAPAGVQEIAAARQRLIEHLADLLSRGRRPPGATAAESPAGTELRLVEGAFALLSNRIVADGTKRLPELAPELVELLE